METTVESVVQKFTQLKSISYALYIGNVNQFVNIIQGTDYDDVLQYYVGKDIQFFKDVLEALGEDYGQ